MTILIAVEEQSTEVAVEKEITLYGLINNFDGLKEANEVEHHIQSETYFDKKGKIRVRGTQNPNEPDNVEYTLTLKSAKSQDGSCTETTTAISKEFAEAFIKDASGIYIKKTRYTFFPKEETSSITANGRDYTYPSNLLKVEIDVFKDKTDQNFSYCKIDIETQDFEKYMSTTYPELVNSTKVLRGTIDLSTLAPQITEIKNPRLDKDKAFIKSLWDKYNISV